MTATFYLIISTVITAAYLVFKLQHDLHMLQQNSYRNERYLKWLNHDSNRIIQKSDIMFFIGLLLTLLPSFFPTLGQGILALFFLIGLPFIILSVFMYFVSVTYQPAKKKLVYTARVKRLYITAVLLGLVILTLGVFVHRPLFSLVLLAFAVTYSSLFALTANVINAPIEARIRNVFLQSAKKRLAERSDRIVIGITGSYGKTSVKHILTELLSRRFNVLMTPGSFNTTLGVVRTINEQLNSTHDAFVVEMGAKEPGDIQEICEIVSPDYGIITSIGPQHLETFGTIETVAATKGELFAGVKSGGVVALNLADPQVASLPRRHDVRYVTFGTNEADYYVTDLQVTGVGTMFTLTGNSRHGRLVETFSTQLLGKHNIDNMLGAIAIALELGVPVQDIHRTLKDLQPIRHRLSTYRAPGGYLVLDDAFNSNPIGSSNALDVLAAIGSAGGTDKNELSEDRQKVYGMKKLIMTPGMVELGTQQDLLNARFGEKIAKICDEVILVGPNRTASIARGIRSQGYPEAQLHVVRNLNEGFALVLQLAGPNDVLLIENDLPDSYNE